LVTLAEIKTQVRQRTDMPVGFITDSEMNSMVNGSLSELFDLVVSRMEDQFLNSITFTVASGQDGYTTTGAIYKIRGLDKSINGITDWASVPKFVFAERNRVNSSTASSLWGSSLIPMCAYDWVGNRIKLIPGSNASGTYQLWYVPMFTQLVFDPDILDSTISQWVEYIIVDCCIKSLAKEQTDATIFVMAKQLLISRIEAMAANRDAGMPERISDVTGAYGGRGWGGYY